MQQKKNLTYIISNISKVVVFEWIAQTYDKEKFTLSFIFLNNSPTEIQQYLEQHNFSCYHIHYRSKRDLISALFKTIKILRKQKTDILHAHLFDASLIGLLAARILFIPKRIHTRHHATIHHDHFKKGVLIDNFINLISTDIIVISKNVQAIVQEKEKFYNGKIHLVYHGFNLDEFNDVSIARIESLKSKYKLYGYPVIGAISRYLKLKGVEYIAEAFIKLLQDYPDAQLTIANAKGSDAEYVKSFMTKIPPNNLVEIIYEKDMPAYYKNMSVFVHVPIDAKSEAFGQTYIEAMAAGIPGVYTLSGIAVEYIEDKNNALVVDYKNADEIYAAIKNYLNNKELKDEIVSQAKADVYRLFSLEKMNEELKKIYLS